jgi:hypothetical protein
MGLVWVSMECEVVIITVTELSSRTLHHLLT